MIHARRDTGSRLRAMLLSIGLLLAGGCAEVTWWDAHGSWSGIVTLPGESAFRNPRELEGQAAALQSDPSPSSLVPSFEM